MGRASLKSSSTVRTACCSRRPANLPVSYTDLFKVFPAEDRQLAVLGRGAAVAQSERWQAAWNREAWPAVSARTANDFEP